MDKVNILLVDDQPAKLLSYEVILDELGENLIKANSPHEALGILLKTDIAVVLIDVVMPQIDGFQLAAMIREHPRFQKLAMIFVSGVQIADTDHLRGYEIGAVDYVTVPVVPEVLRAKVRVFIDLYRKTRQLEALNAELEQRVAERTAEVAEKNRQLEEKQARIDEDLRTARVLQASILPTDFSAYRDTDIAAAMRPALEMSGDFYDVFPLDGGRLGLVVADVSGKGVASAFFMAVTRTMLRNAAQGGLAPADCIVRVNEALCRENPVEMFVTAIYGELEQATGTMRLVNAGHCEPIVVRAGGAAELVRRAGNPPLGVLSGRKFAESAVTLGAGDTLFLYTDGVTEAADRDGEMFRVARLLEAVRPLAGRPAKELMLSVIAGVESFSAGALQADDITCLAVRRNRV